MLNLCLTVYYPFAISDRSRGLETWLLCVRFRFKASFDGCYSEKGVGAGVLSKHLFLKCLFPYFLALERVLLFPNAGNFRAIFINSALGTPNLYLQRMFLNVPFFLSGLRPLLAAERSCKFYLNIVIHARLLTVHTIEHVHKVTSSDLSSRFGAPCSNPMCCAQNRPTRFMHSLFQLTSGIIFTHDIGRGE